MNYPSDHQVTELSTGPNFRRYVVLRLISSAGRSPIACPSTPAGRRYGETEILVALQSEI
jgi:hypothetical protein